MKNFLIILFWCTSFFSLIFPSITVKKDSLLSGYNNVELEILDDDIEVSINTREQKNLFEYFYNLDTSLGDNISNICVPVAFGMILSYYDTYFNDDIIPEEYEVNSYCYNDDFEDYLFYSSPGLFSEIGSYCKDNNGNIQNSLIDNYIQTYEDYVLEELVPISHGSYYSMSSMVDAFVALDDMISHVNTEHFYEHGCILLDSYPINTLMSDACIEYLELGIPLFANLPLGAGLGHAIVIFAYDEVNEVFLYHNGYKCANGNKTNIGLINYSILQVLGSAVFPYEYSNIDTHVCSNNYIDESSFTTYCPCFLNGSSIINHTHSISHLNDYSFGINDNIILESHHHESCPTSIYVKECDCLIESAQL